jgi:arylsulfatase A-like enzyme
MVVSRRTFLGSITLPLLAKKPSSERPNILFILVDGLPAWMLGSYGNKEVQTPNLDRLAQTGARFSNSFVCSPAAALSRATLLSGRTPMQLGDAENPEPSGSDKLLGNAGYTLHSAGAGAAAALLDQQTAGKPFCVTAHYSNFEPPYENADQRYRDLYTSTKFDTLNLARAAAPNAQRGKEMLADIISNVRKAAAVVSAIDAEVGEMIAKLTQKHLLENTLTIFTASCGSLLGRHGLWDSGEASDPVNMYAEVIAVPLILSWLGHVPAQAVRPELVSTYDFVPTLCDLLGEPAPEANLCGRSYLPLATGKPLPKKQPWRKAIFGHYRNTDMARIERYKLVQRDGGKGPSELYDLIADPSERDNQYNNQQFLTVRTTLSQSLAAWKQRYSA